MNYLNLKDFLKEISSLWSSFSKNVNLMRQLGNSLFPNWKFLKGWFN